MENETTQTPKHKKTMIIFESFVDALRCIDCKDTRLECYETFVDYGLYGKLPTTKNPIVLMLFKSLKVNIDNATKRYFESIENGKKGAEFGKMGGAPKGNQNARKNKKTTPKQPLNVDVDNNDNVNVNENVYKNIDENENIDGCSPATVANDKNITLQNGEQIFSEQFSLLNTKFKNSFPLRDCSIRHPERINSINLQQINIDLLIKKINESPFLKDCANLGLEWCLLNYEKIVMGNYDPYFTPKTEESNHPNLVDLYNITFASPSEIEL